MRFYDCSQCGQAFISDARPDERHLFIECRGRCEACTSPPEPRHESVRLFEPAPTQIPGQLGPGDQS